jgi:putative ATPase
MPEGRYHLAMAALYLATAPKSNSVFAFFDALAAIEKEQEGEVPNHLRDASRDKEGFGHGAGYLYPHAYRDHWVAQQYLPDSLQGKMFFRPGAMGYERGIAVEVQRRREAQLAAALDPDVAGAPPEILTYSPVDRGFERWLTRTISAAGAALAAVRDAVFAGTECARHAVVLDLRADTGLLIWEALRQVPEGGVWAVATNPAAAAALVEQATQCPDLRKPHVVTGAVAEVRTLLEGTGAGQVRFDLAVGYNALFHVEDRPGLLRELTALLAPGGVVSLAEAVPRHSQRPSRLADLSALDRSVHERLVEAEEAIYRDPHDGMVNWDEQELAAWARAAGLEDCAVALQTQTLHQAVTQRLLDRWFTDDPGRARPSYAAHLAQRLNADEIGCVRECFARTLLGRTVSWQSVVAVLRGVKPAR